jgi:hypothetical protein
MSSTEMGLRCLLQGFCFLFTYWAGVESSPLLVKSLIGLLQQALMIDDGGCGVLGGINDWQTKPMLQELAFLHICDEI